MVSASKDFDNEEMIGLTAWRRAGPEIGVDGRGRRGCNRWG